MRFRENFASKARFHQQKKALVNKNLTTDKNNLQLVTFLDFTNT